MADLYYNTGHLEVMIPGGLVGVPLFVHVVGQVRWGGDANVLAITVADPETIPETGAGEFTYEFGLDDGATFDLVLDTGLIGESGKALYLGNSGRYCAFRLTGGSLIGPPPEELVIDSSDAGSTSGATVRVSALPVEPPLAEVIMSLVTPATQPRIYERYAVFANEPWVVIQGRPERAPTLGVRATTIAKATAYDVTENLDDALSINIHADRRWLADQTKISAWSGGSGWKKWVASVGDTGTFWKFQPGHEPIIDPEYSYDSRIGEIERPAMIFPGQMYAQTSDRMSSGDEWGLSMVAILHYNTNSNTAYLLNSFQNVPEDPNSAEADRLGKHDLCLMITGDKLMCEIGGRMTYDSIKSFNDRPVIVVASGKAKRTKLLVVERKYVAHDFTHPDIGVIDMRFLLGRPARSITKKRGTARMDLFEIAFFDRVLTAKEMWRVASKLDSIYGVSG